MTKYDQIIGYTTGIFDLFHVGHLNVLKRSKKKCDKLIVGVTTDELAMKLKKKKPIFNFDERIKIVKNIKCVDKVVPQKKIDEIRDHDKYHFHVIFKGDDWKGTKKWQKLEEQFKNRGVRVIYFPYTKGVSSSILRKRIKKFIKSDIYEK